MKSFLEEYGMLIVYTIIGAVLVSLLITLTVNNPTVQNFIPDDNKITAVTPKFTEATPPTLEVDHLNYIRQGDNVNLSVFIKKAEDCEGNSIPAENRKIYGTVNRDVPGEYKIRFAVQDSNGLWAWAESKFVVVARD